jgi:septal ring factor EnvC (AmiA/AmiB activator)
MHETQAAIDEMEQKKAEIERKAAELENTVNAVSMKSETTEAELVESQVVQSF